MAHLKLLSAFLAFTGNKVEGLLQARNPCYGGFALPRTPDDGAVNGCPPKLLPAAKKVFSFCSPNYTFCGLF